MFAFVQRWIWRRRAAAAAADRRWRDGVQVALQAAEWGDGLSGRELRAFLALVAGSHRPMGIVAFYRFMANLEDEGLVVGYYEVLIGKQGIRYRERRYRWRGTRRSTPIRR